MNGKIVTLDGQSSVVQALALPGDRILAVGSNDDMRKLAARPCQGRRPRRPHRHSRPDRFAHPRAARRADLQRRAELDRRAEPRQGPGAAFAMPPATRGPAPGSRSAAAGPSCSFRKSAARRVEELVAAAPDRPVYVQRLYNTAWVTPAGLKAMNIDAQTRNSRRQGREGRRRQSHRRHHRQQPHLQFPHRQNPVAHLRASRSRAPSDISASSNRLGLTGVNDVTGGGMFPVHYKPVQKLWKNKEHDGPRRVPFSVQRARQGAARTSRTSPSSRRRASATTCCTSRGLGEALTGAMYDGSTVGLIFNPERQGQGGILQGRRMGGRAGPDRASARRHQQGRLDHPRCLRAGEQGDADHQLCAGRSPISRTRPTRRCGA